MSESALSPPAARPPEAVSRLAVEVRDLYPGVFALVMATGIISNAFFFLGHPALSDALFAVNLAAYPALLLATAARAALFPRRLWTDLTSPRLVFSFFTIVAGSDVLGISLFLRHHESAAAGLWLVALLLWAFLGYFSFSVLTFVNSEEGADIIHGGWLIAIVGTESLVLLGSLLAPGFGSLAPLTFVAVHGIWGVGIFFYGIFVTLFAYRVFFMRLQPADMTPLFWVVMGAAAISVNAGSSLILSKPPVPFLWALRPFVEGMTLVLWFWSTWWIPLLVVFGIWRHVVRRHPLTYHPMYWSLVFPLGMYTLATYRLSLASGFAPLQRIPFVMIWVAFAAWCVTMLGLARSLATRRENGGAPAAQ